MTAEGALFLERCRRILGEVEAAQMELSHLTAAPRGKLHVGMPLLGELMMPAMAGFMQRYSDIEMDIDLSDRMVDVIEEGFDAVIRTGEPQDSRALAKGELQRVLDEYVVHSGELWMLWPASRHASPKLRALIDYLKDNLLTHIAE